MRQGCILSPYLFNLHAKYILGEVGFKEMEQEISIAHVMLITQLIAENDLQVPALKVKDFSEKKN